MTDIQKKQCAQIFNTYGKIPQLDMLTEECAELIQGVCKYKCAVKYGTHKEANRAKDAMVGEMADVLIMIQQIKDGLGITDSELDASINYKLMRQLERIKTRKMTEAEAKLLDIMEAVRKAHRDCSECPFYGLLDEDIFTKCPFKECPETWAFEKESEE